MLSMQKVTKTYGETVVLDAASLAVNHSEVVALVGANGAGKTTLLKLLAGQLLPDSGLVVRHAEVVGYVPQEPQLAATIAESFPAGLADWQIEHALAQVGLCGLPHTTAIRHLSGGQRTRLALGVVLAADPAPSVLLLDEPTNNLDAKGLAWLRDFISSFDGSIVLVSHDRGFINQVATSVIELDQGKLRVYGGNYDQYVAQKAAEQQTAIDGYAQTVAERRRLTKIRQQKASQMQQTSHERFDKIKHESRAGFAHKKNAAQRTFGKQLKALDTRLADLPEMERPNQPILRNIWLRGQTPAGKLLVRLENISKSYAKRPVIASLNLEIRGGQRLHVAGPNGSGKSTLLSLIAGRLKPEIGWVAYGEAVRIGYVAQDVDGLDVGRSVLDNLLAAGLSPTEAHQQSRTLGLSTDDLAKTPAQLSRGQRAKVAIVSLVCAETQLLILDEPTNHLDVPTREQIERMLQNYRGALIVASHDTYFVQNIAISQTMNIDKII